MATEIAKAYVQIIPSAEGISGGISDIMNGEASKAGISSGKVFSSSFGGGLSKGLSAVGGVATMAAAGVAALGTSLVSNAKETAAYGDNIDKLSQKIGISAESFQEWDYVFSQNGADIGILQSGMKKLSTTFADAQSGSSGAIEKFQALGLSMEQLQGMSQEDLFGTVIAKLQEMGPSAERTAVASDLLGKSATELGPLLNQTAADTEALKQKAHDLGSVMSDAAVKNAAAFTDSLDNLGRAATGVKNSLSSQFLPALTEITNGFAGLISGQEGAADQLKEGFSQLGTSLTEVIPQITAGLTSIVDAVVAIAPEIISSLASGILDALPQLTTSLMGILPELVNVFLDLLPELVDVGCQMLVEIGNGIAQALPDLIPKIVETVMKMVDAFLQNLPELIECGIQILLALVEGIVNAIPTLIEYIPTIITSIVEALVEGIPMLIQGAIQLVMAIVEALPDIIQALIDALPQIIEAIVNALPELVPALIEGAVQLTIALVAALPQIIQALIDALPQIITAIVQGLAALGPALIETFSAAFESLVPVFDNLGKMASKAWQGIQSAFSNIGAWFRSKFNEAVNAIKSVFSSIGAFFKQKYQEILNIFKNIGESFKQVGSNIVEGIKSGIGGTWDKLKNFVKGLVGDLVEFAKKLLGIESPSKVFAQEVGQWIPAGIAEGINAGMPELNKTIDSMTNDMVVGSVSSTSETISNMNYAPQGAVENTNNKAVQLLAEYLPIIAQGMNVDVTVNQSENGIFNAVRNANNRLKTATGYHALA